MAAHRADKLAASLKRSAVATSVAKRTAEWVMSTDVPTDVLVEAGGISFALHKFPLVSRSGKIRKLVAGDSRDLDVTYIKLSELPGGPEAFELAAKFCYGINFEITVTNVATLRCAAAYLEMTEDYGDGNLVTRTEAFINEVATRSLPNAVAVLHSCEKLLPLAEELKIVTRCIDAAATEVCREQLSSLSSHTDFSMSERMESAHPKGATIDWWAEDLAILRIDFYQRVLAAMLSRGLRHETVGAALMHYAHRALKGFSRKHVTRDLTRTKLKVHDTTAATEYEQRILVETIVNMLPREKNAIPCSFLFGLLRTAVILDTSVACRLDLEHRIGMQLEKATLDDLLVPAFSYSGDTLFDIDVIHRIVVSFLKQENDESSRNHLACDSDDDGTTPSQSALMRVAKLVDGYLAEIAPDPNLKVHKFIGLAELFPDHARLVDDSLYRAIDIYLKAHPALTDSDKKKLCKLLDVQKMSQEACQHAAQNERLPVQMVVQVLYHEQMRLRSAMTSSYPDEQTQKPVGPGGLSAAMSPRDHYSSIRRENRELRLEVARMRMRLNDLEKDHVNMKEGIRKTGGSSKLLNSFTKTLSKLNPFGKPKDASQVSNGGKGGTNSRRRRHSIS